MSFPPFSRSLLLGGCSCFVVVIHDEYFLQQVMKVCPLVTSPRSTCEIGAISNLARTASGKRKDLAVSHCHTFCQSFTGFHLRLLVQVQLPCIYISKTCEAVNNLCLMIFAELHGLPIKKNGFEQDIQEMRSMRSEKKGSEPTVTNKK